MDIAQRRAGMFLARPWGMTNRSTPLCWIAPALALIILATTSESDARPSGSQGKVLRGRFQSARLGGKRELFVYLPPGYGRTNKRYPVLYLQDGQNLLGRRGWDVTRAVERETHAGRAHQAIIVGINHAGSGRIHEYSPSHDRQVGGGGE